MKSLMSASGQWDFWIPYSGQTHASWPAWLGSFLCSWWALTMQAILRLNLEAKTKQQMLVPTRRSKINHQDCIVQGCVYTSSSMWPAAAMASPDSGWPVAPSVWIRRRHCAPSPPSTIKTWLRQACCVAQKHGENPALRLVHSQDEGVRMLRLSLCQELKPQLENTTTLFTRH